MGISHRPAAFGIAAAEMLAHCGVQHGAGDSLIGTDPSSQRPCRGQNLRFGGDGKGESGRSMGHWKPPDEAQVRSEEHTSELQSLMRISYAVFCLQNKK